MSYSHEQRLLRKFCLELNHFLSYQYNDTIAASTVLSHIRSWTLKHGHIGNNGLFCDFLIEFYKGEL